MSTFWIDNRMMTHLTAALVLPVLVAEFGTDDEPDGIDDIVKTAFEFGLELAKQVESQFAVEVDEPEKHAS